MTLFSAKSGLTTPLDYMAEGYWQDFLAKRPIAGGIAYESALQECNLDESLLSLQRVDMLLSQIRRDLIQASKWHEQSILTDYEYRNLLIFLAFYTGRVLKKQVQKTAYWYGTFELREYYPQLPVISDDFYQHMALFVKNDPVNAPVEAALLPLFFALEPIGMRLFGHIDRQFHTIFGEQVAGGLYQSLTEFLSTFSANPQLIPEPKFTSKPELKSIVTEPALPSDSSELKPFKSQTSQAVSSQPQAVITKKQIIEPATPVIPVDSVVSIAPITKSLMAESSTAEKVLKPIIVTPEIFTQLLIELSDIEVIQTAGNGEYQQACKILDQFERHIAKQHKPRAQVIFSESHHRARQGALELLAQSATAGNTAAMARLAMYELLDEGRVANKNIAQEVGIDWLKQAASANDSRSQRLLSKLYYQGLGVPQDMESGKLWLEQAAKNGHPEAITVMKQWQQAKALLSVQQKERHSIKRYQLLIAAIVIAAVLLIIFV